MKSKTIQFDNISKYSYLEKYTLIAFIIDLIFYSTRII